MLKINKNVMINEDKIECICFYGNKPLRQIVNESRITGNIRQIKGRYGYKSIIFMSDGYLFLCPYTPEIYLSRLEDNDYFVLDSKKCIIKRSCVREIVTKPNYKQHLEIVKSKKEKDYVNLAGRNKTRYFIFTVSGRIYGLNIVKKASEVFKEG